MRAAWAVPALALLSLAALIGVGVWLLSGTPSSLVNEEPPRIGPTPSSGSETVVVEVEDGDGAEEIGRKLEDAGVIESARRFQVLTALMGLGNELAAGEYEFERGESTLTVVERISQGVTSPLVVTVREGLRAEEIAALLEQRGVLATDEFRRALSDAYTSSFLGELPAGSGIEGFLFPATYGFSRETTGHDAVQQFVTAFDQRYRESILPLLPQPDGLSLHQTVTLASIVEREARVPDERPIIASVFLNRLEQGLPLQADPTVQYALGSDPASVAEFGYWKAGLTLADLAVDSPYNTYENIGLPPGPIANPGLDSILAVLQPADTDYLFFVARRDGSHVFARTLEEHRRNVCAIDPDRPEC
jgi:UPF0755 protein